MQLSNKKSLAAKVLKTGKNRIIFTGSLQEIKEAITRQDILDLHKAGAIKIREKKGRKKVVKRKHRRGIGKVKKRVKKRKQEYVRLTRKLRDYARLLLSVGQIDKESYQKIRKMIRARRFRSKRHMKESLEDLK
ncbi:MAG: 50S ribosomal protein L19e [Candidatus Nanoarchaeia archaeon]